MKFTSLAITALCVVAGVEAKGTRAAAVRKEHNGKLLKAAVRRNRARKLFKAAVAARAAKAHRKAALELPLTELLEQILGPLGNEIPIELLEPLEGGEGPEALLEPLLGGGEESPEALLEPLLGGPGELFPENTGALENPIELLLSAILSLVTGGATGESGGLTGIGSELGGGGDEFGSTEGGLFTELPALLAGLEGLSSGGASGLGSLEGGLGDEFLGVGLGGSGEEAGIPGLELGVGDEAGNLGGGAGDVESGLGLGASNEEAGLDPLEGGAGNLVSFILTILGGLLGGIPAAEFGGAQEAGLGEQGLEGEANNELSLGSGAAAGEGPELGSIEAIPAGIIGAPEALVGSELGGSGFQEEIPVPTEFLQAEGYDD